MNNEEYKPYSISYVFQVQNVEDFYRQLQEYADSHVTEDVEDTKLAEEMLQAIGIKTK